MNWQDLRTRKPKQKVNPNSLGAMVLGPKTVFPKNAKETVIEKENSSPTLLKKQKSSDFNESGTQEIEKLSEKRSSNFERNEEKEIRTSTMNSEKTNQREVTREIQVRSENRPENKSVERTQSTALTTTSLNLKEGLSQVLTSLDTSEKHLITCIESQLPTSEFRKMEAYQVNTVVEATKGILAGLKLKIDTLNSMKGLE